MSSVAAIILAAGQGSRFGVEPKLLAPLDGKPLVRHVAEAAIGSSAAPVILVTGHRAEDVEGSLVPLSLTVIRNPAFAEGLSTSLKAGFKALPEEAEAAVVLLADMPFVTERLIDELLAAWHDRGKPAALIPVCDGMRGNPVVLARSMQGAIEALSGDRGAGVILRDHPGVLEWPTFDRVVLQDVDTPAALIEVSG
jgi:molybdenum cofactor cytidylyltransferase